jgi:hypothetical protein
MSSAFRGKLIENVIVKQLDLPASRTASSTLYNGSAATTTSYIDCQGFDEVIIVLNKGVFTSTATVTFTVVESADTDPSAATLVTGATFTAATSSNGSTLETISIQTKDQKRYLWLKSVKTNVNSDAALWAASAIKKAKQAVPTATTNVIADLPA